MPSCQWDCDATCVLGSRITSTPTPAHTAIPTHKIPLPLTIRNPFTLRRNPGRALTSWYAARPTIPSRILCTSHSFLWIDNCLSSQPCAQGTPCLTACLSAHETSLPGQEGYLSGTGHGSLLLASISSGYLRMPTQPRSGRVATASQSTRDPAVASMHLTVRMVLTHRRTHVFGVSYGDRPRQSQSERVLTHRTTHVLALPSQEAYLMGTGCGSLGRALLQSDDHPKP